MANLPISPSPALLSSLLSAMNAADPADAWAARVNAAVAARFDNLLNALRVTRKQRDEAQGKRESVIGALNRHYYGHASGTLNSIAIGAWGKGTEQRPPRDVDLLFELPTAVRLRYYLRTGNVQSQLLQEIRDVLRETFPRTDIKADGPVVVVGFDQGHGVELAPAFRNVDGTFNVCHTSNGGWYQIWHPTPELWTLNAADTHSEGNARRLIALAKRWQAECNVPLASFELEALVIEFLAQHENRTWSTALFDYLVRDFFYFLRTRANGYIWSPSAAEWHHIGNAWVSRAESAAGRARRASELEVLECHQDACDQWQLIFGTELQ